MRPAPQALLMSGLVCFIIIVLILKLFLDTANWIYGFIGLPLSPVLWDTKTNRRNLSIFLLRDRAAGTSRARALWGQIPR